MAVRDRGGRGREREGQGAWGLRERELIVGSLARQAQLDEVLTAGGVLEILPDGYGFLRSAQASN